MGPKADPTKPKKPKKNPPRKNRHDPLPVPRRAPEGVPLPPRPPGRPTSLNKELADAICGFIEETNCLEDSARLVGCHPSTLHNWLRQGRMDPDGPYGWFYDAVENAKSRRRLLFHRALKQHWTTTHQAVIAHAERTDPKHFGLRVRLEVQEELERALEILRSGLPPDQYETVLSLIARNAGSDQAGEDPSVTPGEGGPAGDDVGPAPSVDPSAAVPEPSGS